MAVDIRKATPDDNQELQELQARCPLGTTLIVSTINTPDFFARVKAYEEYEVYVAVDNNRIIGSGACAIRNAVVNGHIEKVGYQFQLFVAPEYRGRRIAGQLHQVRQEYLKQQGAVLSYALIMEGNTPSMRYSARQGFRHHQTLIMPGIVVFKEMDVPSEGQIRPVSTADLGNVTHLMNETWQSYELYEPMSAETLSQFVIRTPAYTFDNLLILEVQGEIVACLGFWDWSQVTRITLEKMNRKMRFTGLLLNIAGHFRPMPNVPIVGETLKQIVLTPIAFKNPKYLALLLKHLNNVALRRGIGYIYGICEPDNPLLAGMKGFFRIDTKMYLYIKPLREDLSIGDKPLFIDGIDL